MVDNRIYIESVANYLIDNLKYNIDYKEDDIEALLIYIVYNDALRYKYITDEQKAEINQFLKCLRKQLPTIEQTDDTTSEYFILLENSDTVGKLKQE